MPELTVAHGNAMLAQAWDGDEGAIWAEHADFFESSVRRHQAALMGGARIVEVDRVLDIGCGTGGSTVEAARVAHRGRALGIDLSSAMIERARQTSAEQGVTNASFVHGDVQVWPFDPAGFDVAVSRTGSMFFSDPVAAFTNIAGALRPGGRLALVSWRGPEHNEWFLSLAEAMTLGRGLPTPPPDAPTPFAHADATRVEQILTTSGFTAVRCEALDLPMYFGSTVEEGYRVLSQLLAWMAAGVSEPERARARAALRSTLAQHHTPDGVAFGSGAWLITATRM
jgi:SAM-dependent methyltransferase